MIWVWVCPCHTVFRAVTHTHTHTPPTWIAFFLEAACVTRPLFFSTAESVLPLGDWTVWVFFLLTWQIHFWLHWSVLEPSSLVQSFHLTLWEMCWRIRTACGCWHTKVPLAWSGQSSMDLSVRHGFGWSGALAERVRVSADQHRTWTLVLLARVHVSARDDCRQGLKNAKQMQSWATELTEEFDCVTVTCSC